MPHPEIEIDYASPSADATTFVAPAYPARWIQCYGSGTVTMLDSGSVSSATAVSRAYVVTGGEVIVGEWTQLVSTTCTRIRIGTSNTPPPAVPPSNVLNGASVPGAGALTTGNVLQVSGSSALVYAAVNLAGGANYVTGILPAGQCQDWVDAGTIAAVGFTAAVNVLQPFNFQLTANINFPKITAALNGLSVGLVNVGTGATASIIVPSGTDSMGPVANGVTAATAAGPKSLVAQRYTPNITLGQWIPGI